MKCQYLIRKLTKERDRERKRPRQRENMHSEREKANTHPGFDMMQLFL